MVLKENAKEKAAAGATGVRGANRTRGFDTVATAENEFIRSKVSAAAALYRRVTERNGKSGLLGRLTAGVTRFIMGVLLGRAVVFGEYAPFGISYMAASAGDSGWWWSVAGVLAGYMSLAGRIDYLKYIAAAAIIVAAVQLLKGVLPSRHAAFPPVAALVACGAVGAAFTAGRGFTLENTLLFIAELMLAAGAAYFFRKALALPRPGAKEKGEQRALSGAILAALVFSSLTPVAAGGISLGRVLSVGMVILFSAGVLTKKAKSGLGVAVGLVAGLTCDMVSGLSPFYTAVYALSGLAASVFARFGKAAAVAVFVMADAAATVWCGMTLSNGTLQVSSLYECLIAAALTLALPAAFFSGGEEAEESVEFGPPFSEADDAHAERLRANLTERLSGAAEAYHSLFAHVTAPVKPIKPHAADDAASIFRTATDKVCRGCKQNHKCFGEKGDAYDVFNRASSAMTARGSLAKEDLQAAFTARCPSINELIPAVNRELYASLYRKKYEKTLADCRETLGNQFESLANVLSAAARATSEECRFDLGGERRAAKYYRSQGFDVIPTVYQDGAGRVHVEIRGDSVGSLVHRPVDLDALGRAVGRKLVLKSQENTNGGGRVVFAERETYSCEVGAAARRREGSDQSGDSGTFFKTKSGKFYILLSDGMGSGREAALESAQAVRLLEGFLRAEVDAAVAVELVLSALKLKNEGGLYTTIDLFELDVVSGAAVFYKTGAPPSYIREKSGAVKKIAPSAERGALLLPTITRARLTGGEHVFLMTDGANEEPDDAWLVRMIAELAPDEPKRMAGNLLTGSRERGKSGGEDDVSIVAAAVKLASEEE